MIKKITNSNSDYDICVIPISDEDNEFIEQIVADYKKGNKRYSDFIKRFNISLLDVIAFGETNDISYKTLGEIIPEERYPMAARVRENGRTYRCYANPNPSIVMHEDLKSAWKCLLSTLSNPDYLIVYKDHKNEQKK